VTSQSPRPQRTAQQGRLLALIATKVLSTASLFAQPTLPPDWSQQLETVVGNRVEAVNILAGDHAAAGGFYGFRGDTLADLSITKIGGSGEVASRRPLGPDCVEWAPVLLGNLGLVSAENEFKSGYLAGNRMIYDTLAVEGGAGVAFTFDDRFRVVPTLAGIYGRIENEFEPHNAHGDMVQSLASGTLVDWTLETWSIVPGLELSYSWHWGRSDFELSSAYRFFHTEGFESSSPVLGVTGDSSTLENKIEAQVPLGIRALGGELCTGGFFSRTEVLGGAADGLNADYVYTANGRLVVDLLGKLWKVQWLGLGASYFWGQHFDGWAAGADLRFDF
jgi:hypothetical protein